MADPADKVQAIGAAKRSPILRLPAEVPSTGATTNQSEEGAPKRVAPAEEGGEAQDSTAMNALSEKIKQLMAQLSPIRVSFLVDRESRDVRIRVVNATSGEVIREVPPGDVLGVETPEELIE